MNNNQSYNNPNNPNQQGGPRPFAIDKLNTVAGMWEHQAKSGKDYLSGIMQAGSIPGVNQSLKFMLFKRDPKETDDPNKTYPSHTLMCTGYVPTERKEPGQGGYNTNQSRSPSERPSWQQAGDPNRFNANQGSNQGGSPFGPSPDAMGRNQGNQRPTQAQGAQGNPQGGRPGGPPDFDDDIPF